MWGQRTYVLDSIGFLGVDRIRPEGWLVAGASHRVGYKVKIRRYIGCYGEVNYRNYTICD
jgi:hypothetical protein